MIISDIIYHKQIDGRHCGPTVISMALSKFAKEISQEEIAYAIMKIRDYDGKRDSFTYDVCGYITENGIWPTYYAQHDDEKSWSLLIKTLNEKIPVIVNQRYSMNNPDGHIRLVIGYHEIKKRKTFLIVYHDPFVGPNESMEKESFMNHWKPGKNPILTRKNEMVIIRKSKPEIKTELCASCGGKSIVVHPIDFYNRRPEYRFINPNTRIDVNGIQYKCNTCGAVIATFEPRNA